MSAWTETEDHPPSCSCPICVAWTNFAAARQEFFEDKATEAARVEAWAELAEREDKERDHRRKFRFKRF